MKKATEIPDYFKLCATYEKFKLNPTGQKCLEQNFRKQNLKTKFESAEKAKKELEKKGLADNIKTAAASKGRPSKGTATQDKTSSEVDIKLAASKEIASKESTSTAASTRSVSLMDQMDVENFNKDLEDISQCLNDLKFAISKINKLDDFKGRLTIRKQEWETTYKTKNQQNYPDMDSNFSNLESLIKKAETELETQKNLEDKVWRKSFRALCESMCTFLNPIESTLNELVSSRSSLESQSLGTYATSSGKLKKITKDGTAVAIDDKESADKTSDDKKVKEEGYEVIDENDSIDTNQPPPPFSWFFTNTGSEPITCLAVQSDRIRNLESIFSGSTDKKLRRYYIHGEHADSIVSFGHNYKSFIFKKLTDYLTANHQITVIHSCWDTFFGTPDGGVYGTWPKIFLKGHLSAITHLASDPDRVTYRLFSADKSGVILCWQKPISPLAVPLPVDIDSSNVTVWQPVLRLKSPETPITGLATIEEGYKLLSGSGPNKSFCVWNFVDTTYKSSLTSETISVRSSTYTVFRSTNAPTFTDFKILLKIESGGTHDRAVTCGEKAIGVWSVQQMLKENDEQPSGNVPVPNTQAYEFSIPLTSALMTSVSSPPCFTVLSDFDTVVVGSQRFVSTYSLQQKTNLMNIDLYNASFASALSIKNFLSPASLNATATKIKAKGSSKENSENTEILEKTKLTGEITTIVEFPDSIFSAVLLGMSSGQILTFRLPEVNPHNSPDKTKPFSIDVNLLNRNIEKSRARITGIANDWRNNYKENHQINYPSMDEYIGSTEKLIGDAEQDLKNLSRLLESDWQKQYSERTVTIAKNLNFLEYVLRNVMAVDSARRLEQTLVSIPKVAESWPGISIPNFPWLFSAAASSTVATPTSTSTAALTTASSIASLTASTTERTITAGLIAAESLTALFPREPSSGASSPTALSLTASSSSTSSQSVSSPTAAASGTSSPTAVSTIASSAITSSTTGSSIAAPSTTTTSTTVLSPKNSPAITISPIINTISTPASIVTTPIPETSEIQATNSISTIASAGWVVMASGNQVKVFNSCGKQIGADKSLVKKFTDHNPNWDYVPGVVRNWINWAAEYFNLYTSAKRKITSVHANCMDIFFGTEIGDLHNAWAKNAFKKVHQKAIIYIISDPNPLRRRIISVDAGGVFCSWHAQSNQAIGVANTAKTTGNNIGKATNVATITDNRIPSRENDPKALASDPASIVWQLESTFKSPMDPVTGVAIIKDGTKLLSGVSQANNSGFCLWDLSEILRLSERESLVASPPITSPKSSAVFSANSKGCSSTSSAVSAALSLSTSSAALPATYSAASSTTSGETDGISFLTPICRVFIEPMAPPFNSFKILPGIGSRRYQDKIITCGEKALGIWSLERILSESADNPTCNLFTNSFAYEFSIPLQHTATCFTILPDQRTIVVGSKEGFISLYSIQGGKLIEDIDLNKESFVSSMTLKSESSEKKEMSDSPKAAEPSKKEDSKDKPIGITVKIEDKKTSVEREIVDITVFPDPAEIEDIDSKFFKKPDKASSPTNAAVAANTASTTSSPKNAANSPTNAASTSAATVTTTAGSPKSATSKTICPPTIVIKFNTEELLAYKLTNLIAAYERAMQTKAELMDGENLDISSVSVAAHLKAARREMSESRSVSANSNFIINTIPVISPVNSPKASSSPSAAENTNTANKDIVISPTDPSSPKVVSSPKTAPNPSLILSGSTSSTITSTASAVTTSNANPIIHSSAKTAVLSATTSTTVGTSAKPNPTINPSPTAISPASKSQTAISNPSPSPIIHSGATVKPNPSASTNSSPSNKSPSTTNNPPANSLFAGLTIKTPILTTAKPPNK